MAIATVLAANAVELAQTARTMTLECGFTALYRESTSDEWSYADLNLVGWVPGEVAALELRNTPTNLPRPPSGSGGYWLVWDTSDSEWIWHSTLDPVDNNLTLYAYVEKITVNEELHWQQEVTVAHQPSPSGRPMVPARTPVSEVKGLRRLSWRR